MNLDNVTAELRPRGNWEASDLGARLIRRDAAAVYAAWFAVSLPLLAVALLIALATPYSGWATVFYLWFEPIADTAVLLVVSQRLFGAEPTLRAVLSELPRAAWRNRLFWLTPYRLHFARSTAMPITQLEGLSGKERRERAGVVNRQIFNHGTGLTVAYQHLALSFYVGLALLILAFVPAPYQEALGDAMGTALFDSDSRTGTVASLLLVYAAQSALEPWFVGAGFGLYLNRRTQLEGWDLEIAFRRMAARRASVAAPAMAAILIAVFAAAPLYAQEPVTAPLDSRFDAAEVQQTLNDVYADDALSTKEMRKVWRARNPSEQDTSEFDATALSLFISVIAEFGLWILAALLVIVIVANAPAIVRAIDLRARRPAARGASVRIIDATDDAPLPDDISGTVRSHWRDGRHREALALLYRASLDYAEKRYAIVFPDSATEAMCLGEVARQTPENHATFFAGVVRAWQTVAYAERVPEPAVVDSLCERFDEIHSVPQ